MLIYTSYQTDTNMALGRDFDVLPEAICVDLPNDVRTAFIAYGDKENVMLSKYFLN